MARRLTAALSDGRTLAMREPTVDDARLLVAYPKIVGSETDYLVADENGIAGLTVESERAYIENTLSMQNTVMYLGFIGDELVALGDIRAAQRPRIAHTAELSITVKKAYQGIGAGSAMMQAMLDFARETGVLRCIELTVRCDNDRAIRLYERFGFRTCGRCTDFFRVRGAYYDACIMELML